MIGLKRIRQRRTTLRVNSPVSFGILCAMILVLLAGCTYALAAGVIRPGIDAYREAHATPSPTPTVAPVTSTPSPTPDPLTGGTEPGLPDVTPTPLGTPTPVGKLAGRVIGIDPARSYSSKIQGVSTGVYANRLNLTVALLVKEALEAEGATVVLSYSEVKTSIDDAARAKVFNGANVDAVLRIECNSVSASDTRGALMWVPSSHSLESDCKKLAQAILTAYLAETELPKRLYNNSSLREMSDETLFRRVNAPVATLIMGHISIKTDDRSLNDPDFQKKIAKGIADGFVAYFAG